MSQLPSPEEIIAFIEQAHAQGEEPPDRRAIAKAFGIRGPDRRGLRALLSEMAEKGTIDLNRKRAAIAGNVPPVLVLDVIEPDAEGDLLCAQAAGAPLDPPPIFLLPSAAAGRTRPALGVGSRFLGRLSAASPGVFHVKPIKVIGRSQARVLGVFSARRKGGMVDPVNRKAGRAFEIAAGDTGKAKDGDLVWIEPMNARGYGPRRARVVEAIGDVGESQNWSLIALANNEIPVEFPEATLQAAAAAVLPDIGAHEDLRDLPLITIDPKEAKDHDDAVLAEPLPDGRGWRVTVAIADVSWFVRPGSDLDREAQKRGNSVYLVDRVVPMLPEALSNGLCSLKAGEDRPALLCQMEIEPNGTRKKHTFRRGMIRCVAGLSYEEAQNARDGKPIKRAAAVKETVIDPLWEVWAAMTEGRSRKPSLDLDLPERQLLLNKDGSVKGVTQKERLEAHRLIETMMVAANVCAAETLEKRGRPLIYRVHAAPDEERVEGLRTFLESLGYSLPKGQVLTPTGFNRILAKAAERDELEMVAMAILRTQSQAIYDTANIGHFGLNLGRYAHFTSPIRRYADLTVHRGLVAALKLGPGGITAEGEDALEGVAGEISDTERRAVSAERETQDRFLAAYLAGEVGATFPGRINGVTRAGLFITLDETGADGFVPMRGLNGDYFRHDEEARALIGERTGGTYRLGQKVEVELLEVTPVQGGLVFAMLSEPMAAANPPKGRGRTTRTPSGANRKGSTTGRKGAARKPASPPAKGAGKAAGKPTEAPAQNSTAKGGGDQDAGAKTARFSRRPKTAKKTGR